MITGGKTLKLSPQQLARRVDVLGRAGDGVRASGAALRLHWIATLRAGSGAPGAAPVERSGRLAGSIRVTEVSGLLPRVRVGTPIFYGRILHYGVPGRLEPRPHGDIALLVAEDDMNDAFRKAMT